MKMSNTTIIIQRCFTVTNIFDEEIHFIQFLQKYQCKQTFFRIIGTENIGGTIGRCQAKMAKYLGLKELR